MTDYSIKKNQLAAIWRSTHRDFRGIHDGVRCILVFRNGTMSVPLDDLTDEEIASRLPSAIRKDAEPKPARKKRRAKVCTCADSDWCDVHPTDTDCLDPNGPWGPP